MTSQDPLVPANTLLLTPMRQPTTATTGLLVLTCVASASMLKEVAVASTVATALQCLAGVFVVLVIRRIADWQAMPHRVPEDTRRA